MLTYNFEKKGKMPLYEYLYQCIRDDILSGNIAANEKLPSKREMAKNHGISVITVENAYAQLMVEGYIYTEEKRGYFAREINSSHIDKNNYVIKKKEEIKKNWLVDFTSNHIMYDSFPFATWSKVMRQTLLDEEKSFLTSPSSQGVEPLRIAIAKHLNRFRGMEIHPDNIIVGAGTEYLYSIIVRLLGNNRFIALEDPGYQKISKVYESNGVKCLHIKVNKDGIDLDDLVESNAGAVHISPSHHFPTGRVMQVAMRYKLLKWANENNSYIIEDDYDSEFRFSGKPIPTIAGLDKDKVIYMNTFSKTLAPSIRIAYMVLPDKLMEKFHENLGFYSSTVSGFEQYTLANFIEKGYFERHINRMRNYYRDYRNKIISAIKNSPVYDKVTIEEENAGLHFILGVKKEIDDKKFVKILKENNINISALSNYCYNDLKEFRHKFIINYSAVEEGKLKKALEIINNALEEMENEMSRYNGNKDFKIEIPSSVKLIINVLEKNGFEAFAVGGCVRDTILKRNPQDWDITTSAHPLQVKELFNKTIDTGLKHGTVTVLMKGVGYEVTTYRIDGEYNDSRRPDTVEFTKDLIEDLKRRDFTINAMAYNPTVGLVDAFDGIGDLEKKVIKCVGEPKERFGEDALRILRAVRFSAQLGFDIEAKTAEAAKIMASTLKNISAERIQNELEKLIVSDNPSKLIDAYNMDITKVVLSEFDAMMECEQITPYHMYNVGEHTIKVMENVPANRLMRWSALLHDVSKPEVMFIDGKNGRTHFKGHAAQGAVTATQIMRRLKMDNKTIKLVSRLVNCHDDRPADKEQTPEAIRRSVHKIGKDIYREYLQLAQADFQGKSDYGKEKGYDGFLYTCQQFDIIEKENICTSISEMNISGRELIALGCPTGAIIGEILDELLDMVLAEPKYNTKEILEKKAKELIEKCSNI